MKLTQKQIKELEGICCSYEELMRQARERYGIRIFYRDVQSMLRNGLLSQEVLDRNARTRKDERLFVADKITTAAIKHRVIELRGRCCELCGQTEEWEDSSLVLQVHHKDGNRKNNQLTNLMVLCPNCHALTDNYGAKNILSSVDEDFIRELYGLTEDIAKTIEMAGLPLNANSIQIVRKALGMEED